MWIRQNLSAATIRDASRPGLRMSSHVLLKLSTGMLLVCLLVLTSCAGDAPIENEVLGVSIVTNAFGTTQISALGDGVNVEVLNAEREGNSTIGLARDGEIVVMSDPIAESEEISLSVDEPGTYEVWAVTTVEAEASAEGVRLAPAQKIDRLGKVTVD